MLTELKLIYQFVVFQLYFSPRDKGLDELGKQFGEIFKARKEESVITYTWNFFKMLKKGSK